MASPIKKFKANTDDEDQSAVENGLINNLPDDCLIHIFLHLSIKDMDHIKKVCVRWEAVVAQTWRCMKKLDIREVTQDKDEYADIFARCGHSLEELALSQKWTYPRVETSLLHFVELYCKRLKKLSISFWDYTASEYRQFPKIFERNRNYLRCVKLIYLRNIQAKFRNSLFATLPEWLTSIYLYQNDVNSDAGYRCGLSLEAFSRLRNLKFLLMSGFKLFEMSFSALEDLEHLTCLKMHHILKRDIVDVTRLRQLETLEIVGSVELKHEWFAALAANCQNLKYLELRSTKIDGDGLVELTKLPNFTTLSVYQCYGSAIGEGISQLHNLKELIYGTYTRAEYVSESDFISLIHVAKDLRFIDLRKAFVSHRVVAAAYKAVKNRPNTDKFLIIT